MKISKLLTHNPLLADNIGTEWAAPGERMSSISICTDYGWCLD